MDARLQRAIQTPRIQHQAQELVRLALRALDDLRQLDESLYERFVATREAPADPDAAAASLQKLWDTTFSGLRQLLWYCRSLAVDLPNAEAGASGASGDPLGTDAAGAAPPDDDFDFGDFEAKPKLDDDLQAGQRGSARFHRAD